MLSTARGLRAAVALALLGSCAWAQEEPEPKAKPKPIAPQVVPEGAELIVGGRRIKPVAAPSSGGLVAAGELTLQIDQHGITAWSGTEPKWRVAGGERIYLEVVGSGAGVAWIQRWESQQYSDKSGWHWVRLAPAELERLDLETGKWLPQAAVPRTGDPEEHHSQTVGAFVDSQVAVVLSAIAPKPTEKEMFPDTVQWRVTRFDGEEVRWTRTFGVAPGIPGVSALLIGGADAGRMNPGLTPLVRCGDRILVTAGPREPLRALDIGSGADVWSLERVWEFERSYIGPSSYIYVFGRFGDSWADVRKGKLDPKFQARRDALAKRAWMTAGPVVVPFSGGNRIFVAAVRSNIGAPAHVHDCYVYEISSEGKPVAVTTVPRPVDGSVYSPAQPGFVWGCTGGALVKIEPKHHVSMLMRGSDLIARVAWYRQFEIERPKFWMSVPNGGVQLAVDGGRAVVVAKDIVIAKKGDSVADVQLLAVDLERSREVQATLRIRFNGPATPPKMNCIHGSDSNGNETHECFGFNLMRIAGVELFGDTVRITVQREEFPTTTFAFPMRALTPPK